MTDRTERAGRGLIRSILIAWIVAGTLDIFAASLYYPLVYKFRLILLYQNIASGVFGERAFNGGIGMAALGLLFHYLIALTWTVLFFIIYPGMRLRSVNRLFTAAAYGMFVWAIMNLIVLPLSNVEHSQFNLSHAVIAALFLIFCIGLPNALIAGRFYSRNRE